jgi:hypothetical protein
MRTYSVLAIGLASAFCGASAHAQSHASGSLTLIRTGWNADQFGVVLNVPQQNPARCPNLPGYITNVNQPGFKTYYQAALAAYAVKGIVTVAIDDRNCVEGWPRIIGIDLPR